jgi:hypothetical protein
VAENELPVAVFHNKTFNGTAYTVTTKDKTLKKEFSKYDYCPTKVLVNHYL